MSGDILFLAHRLPFPPDRGDRIRSAHVLKALARIAPVHVGCFVDDDADRRHMPELETHAASHCVVTRRKPLPLAGIEALVRHEPVSLTAYRSDVLAQWVRAKIASGRIDAIYVFSGQMGQFVPADWKGHLVMDLVDVDSAKFEAYAADADPLRGWVHARENRLLSGVENALAARADHTLLVSGAEAALLKSRTTGARDIRAMGNGIDADYFAPANAGDPLDLAGSGPRFVFTGQMDYPPNVAAVVRMATAIMPAVRKVLPDARFDIVGRAPSREVLALEGVNGTSVRGAVDDMRPWLAAADVVVAPLSIARGVQNKVLEAMAMARPVVLSPEAATGIDATDQQHFAIARDDAAFVAQLVHLAQNPGAAAALGQAARAYVLAEQSWEAALAQLPQLMGMPSGIAGERNAA